MMSHIATDLGQDLVRIHKVITRGLDVSLKKGLEYLESGLPDATEMAGYSYFAHCLVTVLGAHHKSEDLISFPVFRSVLPNAPYARLASDHHKIEMSLASIQPSIKELVGGTTENSLSTISNVLTKINVIWAPHIYLEEQFFSSEIMNSVLTIEEQQHISQATGKHSLEHSEPPYWVIPFILFNLEGIDRETMASFLPKPVTEEMVPKAWRENWEPMKPFLLD